MDDDNVLARPVVAGSTISIGDLVTIGDLQSALPKTGNPWVDAFRDPGMLAVFLTKPKIDGAYFCELRANLRKFTIALAMRRLVEGVDHRGRKADYPALDRRLAREALAAMNPLPSKPLAAVA